LGLAVATISLVAIFRYPLMNIFTNNSEIIAIGAQLLLLSFVLDTGRSINIVIVNALRATGDAKFPLYAGFFSMVGMSLPLGWLFVFHFDFGIAGVWLAIAADEWLRAGIMFFRWRSRAWEKHALFETKAVVSKT